MSFLEELHKPDILDCISHLSSDEVFTPPKLVNEILDTLPQELFKSPDTKFLDPCTKSGVFLREIAKRLIEGLADKIPDLQERLDHIFKNQLYGLAITELTALLSRRSLYCSKNANSEFSICKFENSDGNIDYQRINHIWGMKNSSTGDCSCTICGASAKQWNRDECFENHAYSFIHCNERQNSKLFERLKNMKFDVIIGNPPYQLSNGCFGAGASPLYHYFVQQAKKLNPRYITMIIPARWYAGGRGLDSFRDEMLKDNRIRILHDFLDASDCFPGVEIKGGVCYFLWDRDNRGECLVSTHKSNIITSQAQRPLLEQGCNTFIRYNESISILRKVKKLKETTIDTMMSGQTPFGLNTNYTGYQNCEDFTHNIKLYYRGGIGFVSKKDILTNYESIPYHKILIPNSWGNGSSGNTQDVIKPIYVEPNSCCTQTYMVAGKFNNEKQAKNYKMYLETLFVQFLISLKKNTQHAQRVVYQFVPIQNFDEEWSDERLWNKYNLTDDEISFIKATLSKKEN